jgi:hypothetical protein
MRSATCHDHHPLGPDRLRPSPRGEASQRQIHLPPRPLKKKKTNRLARRFLRKQSGTAPLRVPRGDVGHAASPRRHTSHLFFLIFRRLVSTPSGSLLEAALLRLKTDHLISRPASTADAPRRLQLRASRCLKAPGSRRLRSDLNKPSLHSLSISLRIRNRPLM